jgi:hypothetical protein
MTSGFHSELPELDVAGVVRPQRSLIFQRQDIIDQEEIAESGLVPLQRDSTWSSSLLWQ